MSLPSSSVESLIGTHRKGETIEVTNFGWTGSNVPDYEVSGSEKPLLGRVELFRFGGALQRPT